MSRSSAPALSVVVVSFHPPALLERCLSSLADQYPGTEVEVLVVRREAADGHGTERLKKQFPGIRWVPAGEGDNVPRMRTLGLTQSTGEVVALIEDDCIADGDWIENLLEAHRSPAAAIGGIVKPGQYSSRLNWASYFSEYGRFMTQSSDGALPGTNVSYKRAALDGRNGRRTGQFRSSGFYETFVHQALRRDGAGLESLPGLSVTNIKGWEPREALRSHFHHGRGYAAMRVGDASMLVRAAYALAVSLVPALQIFRISRQVLRRRGLGAELVQAMPWLIVLSVSWSVGEFLGYLFGAGDSLDRWR